MAGGTKERRTMMDYEKLIRRLRNDADAYRNGKTLGRAFADQEDVLDNAATALSTLQAENEKLREMYQKEKAVCHATQAKLDQMKRERDAAVEDLHKLCPTWKWDGQKEE